MSRMSELHADIIGKIKDAEDIDDLIDLRMELVRDSWFTPEFGSLINARIMDIRGDWGFRGDAA